MFVIRHYIHHIWIIVLVSYFVLLMKMLGSLVEWLFHSWGLTHADFFTSFDCVTLVFNVDGVQWVLVHELVVHAVLGAFFVWWLWHVVGSSATTTIKISSSYRSSLRKARIFRIKMTCHPSHIRSLMICVINIFILLILLMIVVLLW